MRFIRLWKKLGWMIDQTDAVICALYRTDLQPLGAADVNSLAKLDAGFLTLLPRLGIVVRVMRSLNLTPKRDLLPLLACWSDIGTHGDGALYRQMFLNPAILKQDAVFADNGFGEFLQKVDVTYTHSQANLSSPFAMPRRASAMMISTSGCPMRESSTSQPAMRSRMLLGSVRRLRWR